MRKLKEWELREIIDEAYEKIKFTNCYFKHKKTGEIYFAFYIALDEKTLKPVVIYGKNIYVHWVRDLDDFLEKFEHTNETPVLTD